VRFSVVSVTIETVSGLVVALVLNAEFKGRGLVRAAILIPWSIPTIVSTKMWAWMLNDQYVIINDVLLRVGAVDQKIAWTAKTDTAMCAVLMVDVWKTTRSWRCCVWRGCRWCPATSRRRTGSTAFICWKCFSG